ncbi:MAG TPA: hypothetical protein DD640_00625, partial [Clostridiales bacterium]|nr:hypothetical protein [Clostridiales bacterium]
MEDSGIQYGSLLLSSRDWTLVREDITGISGQAISSGKLADYGPDLIAASVPGNVQSDLEAAHRLSPLWYGAGDPRLFDVALSNWW